MGGHIEPTTLFISFNASGGHIEPTTFFASFNDSEGYKSRFFIDFLHRISRMNRRQSCLSDYSRIFADIWPLANGWRPKYAAIVLSRRFRRWRRFSSWEFFVPQISQISQIFYGISGESLCLISGGICNERTGRIREKPWVIAPAENLRINSVSSYE